MRPTGHWLGCLAMAGSCLVWAGCGGSDVPDPDSDSRAAVEPTAKPVNGAAAAESAPEAPTPPAEPKTEAAPATVAAPSTPAPAAEPEPSASVAAAKSASPEPAPSGEPAASPTEAKAADTSGTDEMLRIAASPTPTPSGDAASPAPTATPAATAAPAATPGPTPPPTPTLASTGSGAAMREQAGAAMPRIAEAEPGNAAGMRRMGGDPGSGAGQRGGGAGPPGPGGAPSGSAAPGGGGNDQDGGPRAFQNPGTAVQAFLSALKNKNKDRLSQATARRAATEASEKHRKVFAAILEQSISDEELDDMAKALQGFQVQSILSAQSTGSIGVLISKIDNRDMLQRTVMVRREKEGWKVLDFKGVVDITPTGAGVIRNRPRR